MWGIYMETPWYALENISNILYCIRNNLMKASFIFLHMDIVETNLHNSD